MRLFAHRRELIEFCILLSGAVIFAIFAKFFMPSHMLAASVLSIIAGGLAWVAVIRELNAAAIYFPHKLEKAVHWIHAQTLELIFLVGLVFLRLATWGRKNDPDFVDAKSRPILLVHGYLNAGFVWDFHKNFLTRRGFGPIYTIDLGYPFHSIRTYAERLQEKARQIAIQTGRPDLTLIGHSMGGLVSYYYATKLANANSIPQVITIASPLQGTRVAKIGLGRCAREMQIDSDFVSELKSAVLGCPDIKFYNIATKTDELVVPYSSSVFKSEPHHQLFIDDVGHASLLFSKRVANQLCQWLREA